ncbi:MAG: RHS repeat-associated core domain-containing protein [Armatimonadetes bacterium]|nr:RHS repeat-associated core domain-containing protein [Armatimonadota bacterium]
MGDSGDHSVIRGSIGNTRSPPYTGALETWVPSDEAGSIPQDDTVIWQKTTQLTPQWLSTETALTPDPALDCGTGLYASQSFTGREWDEETGLYFYRSRYIDPNVGRFTQEDPIGMLGGLNLYGYVGNNPVGWVDPFGLYSYLVFTPDFPPGVGHVAFGIGGDVWSMGQVGSSGAGFSKYSFATYIGREQEFNRRVQIIVLNTTPKQEEKMREYLQKRVGPAQWGARSHCGVPILGALREVGIVVPPENMWSEHLERRAVALTPIELVLSFTLPISPLRQQYLSGTYAIPANGPTPSGPWFGGALAYPAR